MQITSPYVYSNFKGFSYIIAVGQHPYAEGECAAQERPLTGRKRADEYAGFFACALLLMLPFAAMRNHAMQATS